MEYRTVPKAPSERPSGQRTSVARPVRPLSLVPPPSSAHRGNAALEARADFADDHEDETRIEEVPSDPLIGRRLGGYRLLERLGDGTMGRVYRATHIVHGGEYAVKVIHAELAADPSLVRRLKRESEVVRTLRHPNVVSLLDSASFAVGCHYLVMELLRGKSLAQVISAEAPLEISRAARIARQIADGLQEAHRLGFVHRDLKPDNIMIVEENGEEVAKILDFGLAADNREGGDSTQITLVGNLLGTPTYIAPEQIFHSGVTFAADLYALGVILYEMIAGRPPFQGTTVQILSQHNAAPPPPLPPCGGLETYVMRLLEKKPERRPTSAGEVAEEISRLVSPAKAPLAPAAFTDPIRKRSAPWHATAIRVTTTVAAIGVAVLAGLALAAALAGG